MATKRQQYSAEFKLRVVLKSLQTPATSDALVCQEFKISNSLLHRWRQEFYQKAPFIFLDKRDPKRKAQAQSYAPGESPEDLKKIIDELLVENELLKKAKGLLGN